MSISPELAAAEFAASMTALDNRVYATPDGGRRRLIAANSADGRWAYEKEGRAWVAFCKVPGVAVAFYAGSLDNARRDTFDYDHPVCGPERESQSVRFTFS